jgi:hypothetical protein
MLSSCDHDALQGVRVGGSRGYNVPMQWHQAAPHWQAPVQQVAAAPAPYAAAAAAPYIAAAAAPPPAVERVAAAAAPSMAAQKAPEVVVISDNDSD